MWVAHCPVSRIRNRLAVCHTFRATEATATVKANDLLLQGVVGLIYLWIVALWGLTPFPTSFFLRFQLDRRYL